MPDSPEPVGFDLEQVNRRKARVQAVRAQARQLLDNGSTGMQAATAISLGMDELHRELFEHELLQLPVDDQSLIQKHSAVAFPPIRMRSLVS